jgi:hypothetical protein
VSKGLGRWVGRKLNVSPPKAPYVLQLADQIAHGYVQGRKRGRRFPLEAPEDERRAQDSGCQRFEEIQAKLRIHEHQAHEIFSKRIFERFVRKDLSIGSVQSTHDEFNK